MQRTFPVRHHFRIVRGLRLVLATASLIRSHRVVVVAMRFPRRTVGPCNHATGPMVLRRHLGRQNWKVEILGSSTPKRWSSRELTTRAANPRMSQKEKCLATYVLLDEFRRNPERAAHGVLRGIHAIGIDAKFPIWVERARQRTRPLHQGLVCSSRGRGSGRQAQTASPISIFCFISLL